MDKMDYYVFRRKYLLRYLGKLREILKQQLVIEQNPIITLSAKFFVLFCFFQPVFFQPVFFQPRCHSSSTENIKIGKYLERK